jgi:hypothetical protein
MFDRAPWRVPASASRRDPASSHTDLRASASAVVAVPPASFTTDPAGMKPDAVAATACRTPPALLAEKCPTAFVVTVVARATGPDAADRHGRAADRGARRGRHRASTPSVGERQRAQTEDDDDDGQ